MEERFVSARDGTALFVRSSGAGLPVVLCDGIGCDGFVLRHLRPALESRYRVVNWHYRGHGQSQAPADPRALGIPELRSDLAAVLDALGIERAVLLGYSMGVQLALDFALHQPQRVAGLVPMCGSYGHLLDTFHDGRLLARAFPLLREAVYRWPQVAQRLWTRAATSDLLLALGMRVEVEWRLIGPEDLKPYVEHLGHMDAGLFIRMLDQVRHHTVEPRLHEINAPTLVIAGEKDTFTPVWLSRRMARHIPGAEILVVPFGTHAAPLEMPELITLRLQKFLAERVEAEAVQPAPRARRRPQTAAPRVSAES